MGPTVTAIANRLGDSLPKVRSSAVKMLPKVAPVGDEFSLFQICAHLDHKDPEVRKVAIDVLPKVSKHGHQKVINSVSSLLEDDVWFVRYAAEEALCELRYIPGV